MVVYIGGFLTYDNPILKYVCLFRNYELLICALDCWHDSMADMTKSQVSTFPQLHRQLFGDMSRVKPVGELREKNHQNQVRYLCIGKLSRHLFRFNTNSLFIPMLDWCSLDPRDKCQYWIKIQQYSYHNELEDIICTLTAICFGLNILMCHEQSRSEWWWKRLPDFSLYTHTYINIYIHIHSWSVQYHYLSF